MALNLLILFINLFNSLSTKWRLCLYYLYHVSFLFLIIFFYWIYFTLSIL